MQIALWNTCARNIVICMIINISKGLHNLFRLKISYLSTRLYSRVQIVDFGSSSSLDIFAAVRENAIANENNFIDDAIMILLDFIRS